MLFANAGMQTLAVPRAEHEARIKKLRKQFRADGYDGLVLFDPINIQYTTGCYHLPRERPFVVGISDVETHIVVPGLEATNAKRPAFPHDQVHTYFDYPQGEPMKLVGEMCEQLGISNGQIVADHPGSPEIMGYKGPDLTAVTDAEVTVKDYITEMREVKSDTELELVREASKWANFGHRLLEEQIRPGALPIKVSAEVEGNASKRMLQALDGTYEMIGRTRFRPIQCSFTTSSGSEEPHNPNQIETVKEGDSLVTILISKVGGYGSELERTMFVGDYTDEQEYYFELMREAGELAMDEVAPDVPYAHVDDVVTSYFEEQGVADFTQHHVGHNLGLEKHERPFLDSGMDGEIRENELFTIEPGLYIPDLGGFRHSDTIRVTSSGMKRLTYRPRDIESVTIPIN